MAAAAKAIAQYQGVDIDAGVSSANPHQLIEMLLRGALDRIAIARAAIERGDLPEKARRLSTAVAIVQELAACLNLEQGGEMAANLQRLYDYLMRRLVEANANADAAILDEVAELLMQVYRAWEGLPAAMARPTPVIQGAAA